MTTPEILDEQNNLQVNGTTAETTLYSFTVPAGTLSAAASGKRVHLAMYVHLSNGLGNTQDYTFGMYFGPKKVGEFLTSVGPVGNKGLLLDMYLSVAQFAAANYLCVEIVANTSDYFAYNGPVNVLDTQPPFLGEALFDAPGQIDSSVDNPIRVTATLAYNGGTVFVVLGNARVFLE